MYNSLKSKSILPAACGILAFVIWGLAPLYWKQISQISSLELLGHRILWGCLSLFTLMFIKEGKSIFFELKEKGSSMLFLSSALIFANWFLFVWAVNNDHIIDASLGYYLTPLINVLSGYFLLKESMGAGKIAAVILAFIGVGFLFISNSGNPWISLLLACTFSLYGFLKKKSDLSAESALLFEMLVWTLPVLGYFIYLAKNSQLVSLQLSTSSVFYVFCAGLVTITPLWLFNTAVKKLDLGTVGFLQFLAPSIQLAVGVFLFKESFEIERLISFGLIWVGILVYSIESYSLRKGQHGP